MTPKDEKIPQYVIDQLARMLLPEIRKFYENSKENAFDDNENAEDENTESKPD